nr:unnamed protein product [Digitaria exilis]
MVTTVKSRPPHASFAMSGRRHRASPAAPSCSSFTGGSLLALCCLTVVLLAFSVSAAAEDCAEESDGADGDGRCLGFRDACAEQSAFCFSSSVAQTLLASEDGIKAMDLDMSSDWGPSSAPLGFPMPGGAGVVSCSSVDTTLARGRHGLGRDGDAGVGYNVACCQAPLVPDNWMRASTGVPMELDGPAADIHPSALQSSSSMNVAINPPVLDWGRSDLYAASKATLTMVNLNNDSALRLYEPFSTDPQFYVYGYEDLELQPGDNATEVAVWMSSLESTRYSSHLVCKPGPFDGALELSSSSNNWAMKEHKRTEEVLTEKYSSSVIDSSTSTVDKNSPDEQLHTATTVSVSPANPVEDKTLREAPQTSENLTIRIARDKGRRRKRKVGGSGLAGKFEVSSSHSGNSTPSSPLSQCSTPKQVWSFSGTPSELKHENKLETGIDVEATTSSTGSNREKKTWSQIAKEQPRSRSASPGTTSPSAPALTTTAWRSPMLATSSPIAPQARAPGSNLVKDKAVKRGEGAKLKKDYTYDIWGDHFLANLLGIARNGAPCKMPAASEGAPYSLFAREPPTLMMKPSSAPPVSRGRGSPPSDVATGSGIK